MTENPKPKIGRPGINDVQIARVIEMRRRNPELSVNRISQMVGVSRDAVSRVLARAGLRPPRPSRPYDKGLPSASPD
jgi:predicted transcriptional regulator